MPDSLFLIGAEQNWGNELYRWIGKEKINPLMVTDTRADAVKVSSLCQTVQRILLLP